MQIADLLPESNRCIYKLKWCKTKLFMDEVSSSVYILLQSIVENDEEDSTGVGVSFLVKCLDGRSWELYQTTKVITRTFVYILV